jgi:hypothetical protein
VFKGKRIALRTLLASLAGGDSLETILTDLPSLEPEDIRAAIAFATASAEEDPPVRSADSMKNKLSSPAASVASRKYSATISGRI